MTGLEAGTAAQWGTFGVSLGILVTMIVGVAKVLPEWMRARNERTRDQSAERRASVEEWRVLQAQVARDLSDCRRERAQDAERIQIQDDKIFLLQVVVSMQQTELDKLDPGSDVGRRVKGLLMMPVMQAGAPNPDGLGLEQLLDQLNERSARRSAHRAAEREGHSGA